MRYMLLIYSKELEMETMPEEEAERIREAHYAVMRATAARGIFRGAEPLKSTGTATTVRVQNGRPLITDGPFAETKEQLLGFYVLEFASLEDAIAGVAEMGRDEAVKLEIRPLRLFLPGTLGGTLAGTLAETGLA